jgi:hypothetical protein
MSGVLQIRANTGSTETVLRHLAQQIAAIGVAIFRLSFVGRDQRWTHDPLKSQ